MKQLEPKYTKTNRVKFADETLNFTTSINFYQTANNEKQLRWFFTVEVKNEDPHASQGAWYYDSRKTGVEHYSLNQCIHSAWWNFSKSINTSTLTDVLEHAHQIAHFRAYTYRALEAVYKEANRNTEAHVPRLATVGHLDQQQRPLYIDVDTGLFYCQGTERGLPVMMKKGPNPYGETTQTIPLYNMV